MRIEVENLTPQREAFAHIYGEGELSLDDDDLRLEGETKVEGSATRKGEEVRLSGMISANVASACDRCLRSVELPLEIEFSESYVPLAPQTATHEEKELKPSDLNLSFYEGDEIDIDALVREQILLAMPTQLFCREDCRGLCEKCRADLNEGDCSCPKQEIDPRWAALAGLKKT